MQQSIWRFLDTGCADGPTNMAIDEAILHSCAQGNVLPTLRLYAWNPPCLSIGYFQRAYEEVREDECERLGISCVRRLTGGRAVLHDRELTYSIIIPASHPLAAGGIVNSYRSISRGLAAGLSALGLPVETAPARSSRRPRDDSASSMVLDRDVSSACFDLSSDYELTVRGRKLVGSAQTRKRGVVLQHGTILIDFDAARTAAVLRTITEDVDRFTQLLHSRVVSLWEALGREITYDEVARSIEAGFEQALGITLERGELTPTEIELAFELREAKYTSAAWNFRR